MGGPHYKKKILEVSNSGEQGPLAHQIFWGKDFRRVRLMQG